MSTIIHILIENEKTKINSNLNFVMPMVTKCHVHIIKPCVFLCVQILPCEFCGGNYANFISYLKLI